MFSHPPHIVWPAYNGMSDLPQQDPIIPRAFPHSCEKGYSIWALLLEVIPLICWFSPRNKRNVHTLWGPVSSRHTVCNNKMLYKRKIFSLGNVSSISLLYILLFIDKTSINIYLNSIVHHRYIAIGWIISEIAATGKNSDCDDYHGYILWAIRVWSSIKIGP